VSRGCNRLEESGCLYLVDPIAIIKVWGEEVLASNLDGDRLWRQGPGVPGGSELCLREWFGTYMEMISIYTFLLLHRKPELLPCLFSYPLEVRPLKAAYIWWREPIPLLGDRLWVCRVRVWLQQQHRWMVWLRDASLRSRMRVGVKNKRWRHFWDASYHSVEFHSDSSKRLVILYPLWTCNKLCTSICVMRCMVVIYLLWWDLYAIATDPGTIAKVQDSGFRHQKSGVLQVVSEPCLTVARIPRNGW
jgi:hypothetical protein